MLARIEEIIYQENMADHEMKFIFHVISHIEFNNGGDNLMLYFEVFKKQDSLITFS